MDQALRQYILLRDGGCVARFVNSHFYASRWPMLQGLPDPGECKNMFGSYESPSSLMNKTIDHVEKADELSFATRPPDDPDHLWTLCSGHHQGLVHGAVWATKHEVREAARAYIEAANEAARRAGWPPLPVPEGQ